MNSTQDLWGCGVFFIVQQLYCVTPTVIYMAYAFLMYSGMSHPKDRDGKRLVEER